MSPDLNDYVGSNHIDWVNFEPAHPFLDIRVDVADLSAGSSDHIHANLYVCLDHYRGRCSAESESAIAAQVHIHQWNFHDEVRLCADRKGLCSGSVEDQQREVCLDDLAVNLCAVRHLAVRCPHRLCGELYSKS